MKSGGAIGSSVSVLTEPLYQKNRTKKSSCCHLFVILGKVLTPALPLRWLRHFIGDSTTCRLYGSHDRASCRNSERLFGCDQGLNSMILCICVIISCME